MYELIPVDLTQITVEQAHVNFPNYEQLLSQALFISEELENTIVSADTVKANKKIVAEVAKSVKKLNSKRLELKKYVLEPFTDFENKCKTITDLVTSSELKVRKQIKDLEDMDKLVKAEEIESLFKERVSTLEGKDFYIFDRFMKKEYLNKSYSINKILKELDEFITQTFTDIHLLVLQGDYERCLHLYTTTKMDAVTIIKQVEREHIHEEEIQKSINRSNVEHDKKLRANGKETKTRRYFIELDESNFYKVKDLLKESEIPFKEYIK